MEGSYDVIIIGAGFAGYTAAIYSARYKLKTLLIGKEPGGLITEAHQVENYPGYKKISGLELMQKFEEQARECGAKIIIDEVVGLDHLTKEGKASNFIIHTSSTKLYESKAVIFASGTKKRKLDIPGQKEFESKGVHYCATCDAPFYKNKTVGVVGGSNAAAFAADLLRQYAKKVYLIYRKEELRCEPMLADALKADPKIEIIYSTNLTEYKGSKFLEKVMLDKEHNDSKELAVDGIFVEIGGLPASIHAAKLGAELGPIKEIIVNSKCETKVPGLFAAGDVTNTPLRQGIVAAGQGSIAATSAYKYVSGKSMGSGW
ncbi:FAD-dependent oxidoreductase [Candidatus Woesearchaeota archaeon]|nr:FAD-dependent oxidoreductase [Candidatus Woesearchaeota archaeon]